MPEPKKETVPIALPPRADKASPSASAAKHDAVRIVLPSRTPVAPPRHVPPRITPVPVSDSAAEPAAISLRRPRAMPPESVAVSPLLHPLPKPPGLESRAALGPLPSASETGAAGSTQAGPKTESAARINTIVTPSPLDPFDAIPRPFSWGLFGIAAFIFLIQIWNYVVS